MMTPWMDAAFTKSYPGTEIQGSFQWTDRPRRITALFGPSGCGKTTLLRCLAGLERVDSGFIRAFGETWSDQGRQLHTPPQRRRVGFLFQDYMLFPHLTVRDNIGYGVPRPADRPTLVNQLLNRFHLAGLDQRLPRELSGGQQQRVALARVLAAQPRLLCLDEPLSALDGPTRTELRIALREWLHELQLPAFIVSHDAIEVQSLADDVIVMSHGQALQSGPVEAVLHQPVNTTVARIVGFENRLPVSTISASDGTVQVAHQAWHFTGLDRRQSVGSTAAIACLRAEDIQLVGGEQGSSDTSHMTQASIVELIPEGVQTRIRLRLISDHILQALVPRIVVSVGQLQSGASVRIGLAARSAVVVAD